MKLKRRIVTALFAALLCILAPVAVPVGAIPVSLGSFCVAVLALITNRRCSLVALLLYVALGAVGLPVFAGFTGGGHVLVGPTGGYLFGYIPMVLVISMVSGKTPSVWREILGLVLGQLVCYGFGVAWYAVCTDVSLSAAIAVGVFPFLLFDALKLTAAEALNLALGKRIRALLSEVEER